MDASRLLAYFDSSPVIRLLKARVVKKLGCDRKVSRDFLWKCWSGENLGRSFQCRTDGISDSLFHLVASSMLIMDFDTADYF